MALQEGLFRKLSSERLLEVPAGSSPAVDEPADAAEATEPVQQDPPAFEAAQTQILPRIEGGDAGFSPPAVDDLKEHYTWDLCMVYKVGREEEEINLRTVDPKKYPQGGKITEKALFRQRVADIVVSLEKAGLHVMSYASVQKDEWYVLIGADEARLRQEADRLGTDLLLDASNALQQGQDLGIKLALMTVYDVEEGRDQITASQTAVGPDGKVKITIKAWENLYAKFKWFDNPDRIANKSEHEKQAMRDRASLYRAYKDAGPYHPKTNFTVCDRLKLTNSVIEADKPLGGAQVKTNTHGKYNNLLAYFPLHDSKKKEALYQKWHRWTSLVYQPIDEIRAYYGEAVALYFAFLSFYTTKLWVPAILGLALFIWQLAWGRVDVEGL
eukprot:g31326.t1